MLRAAAARRNTSLPPLRPVEEKMTLAVSLNLAKAMIPKEKTCASLAWVRKQRRRETGVAIDDGSLTPEELKKLRCVAATSVRSRIQKMTLTPPVRNGKLVKSKAIKRAARGWIRAAMHKVGVRIKNNLRRRQEKATALNRKDDGARESAKAWKRNINFSESLKLDRSENHECRPAIVNYGGAKKTAKNRNKQAMKKKAREAERRASLLQLHDCPTEADAESGAERTWSVSARQGSIGVVDAQMKKEGKKCKRKKAGGKRKNKATRGPNQEHDGQKDVFRTVCNAVDSDDYVDEPAENTTNEINNPSHVVEPLRKHRLEHISTEFLMSEDPEFLTSEDRAGCQNSGGGSSSGAAYSPSATSCNTYSRPVVRRQMDNWFVHPIPEGQNRQCKSEAKVDVNGYHVLLTGLRIGGGFNLYGRTFRTILIPISNDG